MRKGDTVNGQYEYSDGYMRVRVDYTADRAGYRVIKEERIPMKKLNTTSHPHQAVLCMNLAFSQLSPPTFDFSSIQPVYQEIRGLPSNQQGFIISHPNYQQGDFGELTPEQQLQIKAQEDFRRAVAEANKKRLNGGEFEATQELPFIETVKESQPHQLEPARLNQRSDVEIMKQQLPLQSEPPIQQQPASSVSFESLRVPETELILPPPGDNLNFNEETLTQQQFDAQKFREQAENARYSFKAAVSDSVNDNSHIRQESRDGLKLTGLYSYSDGYFKRTVHYAADENGYRVLKEESKPIGTGPRIDPTGKVDVSTQVAGSSLEYTIKGENLPPPLSKHN